MTASVFLCVSDHEGFCVPLVEAMAFRVPIVAWGTTAVGETAGGCGWIIDRYDPEELAKGVAEVIDNPATAREFAARGRCRYETVFQKPAIHRKLLSLVEEVRRMSRRRIAFVVQRYGPEITGGSEAHCREIAERMSKHYDVEVLTTCALDHLSWKNVFPEGMSEVDGIPVRRFPAREERHLLNFHKIYDRIFTWQLTPDEEHQMLRHQGPYCPDLIEYLKTKLRKYDAFIFFTYMYYTTVYGLPLVKDKAIFVPTAHDEASLYLRILDDLFRQTPRICSTPRKSAHMSAAAIQPAEQFGRIVGMGVDEPAAGAADALWDEELSRNLDGKQVLTYVGRVENGKGCDELVDFFTRFIQEQKRSDLILLLLGKRTLPLSPHPQILSPGFVSEYVKYQALANSDVAIAPSPFESLCIAALESWMHRRPLLVNGRCPVLVGHCVRSNGGLWYANYGEFRESLEMLLADSDLRRAFGENGREYVEQNYRWPVVERHTSTSWRTSSHLASRRSLIRDTTTIEQLYQRIIELATFR